MLIVLVITLILGLKVGQVDFDTASLNSKMDVELNYTRSVYDVGLYFKKVDGKLVLVTVYVDDVMIIGAQEVIDLVKKELLSKFAINDLGRVYSMLGMEVHYEPGVLPCLSQIGYIE
ncbi:Reverse transcriptase (RNA-dependent DNA polymerase) [Phytophthora infestans]|uniref:Reverse transcriptase (RNA-dependent DNA polymerase) n=1 Tax=Phytophthora infestans TaxID=4787 RepID=A0A833WK70_PHYIN|nr:Reverse transcriptase (RNA-dependent DNA polymerase) [Phytophthora infestans]